VLCHAAQLPGAAQRPKAASALSSKCCSQDFESAVLQNGKGRRAFRHNPQACLFFHELENYLQSFKNARLRCNQCWPIETCLSAFDNDFFTKVAIRIPPKANQFFILMPPHPFSHELKNVLQSLKHSRLCVINVGQLNKDKLKVCGAVSCGSTAGGGAAKRQRPKAASALSSKWCSQDFESAVLQNGKGRRAFRHNPQACLFFHELENYLQSFKNARLRCNQCWPIETCLSAFDFTKVAIRIPPKPN
jgi:hypothetical protein